MTPVVYRTGGRIMVEWRRADAAAALAPVVALVAWVAYWPAYWSAITYAPPSIAGIPVAPFVVAGAGILAAAALVATRHVRRRWLPLLAVLVVPFLATLVFLPAVLVIVSNA